MPSTVEARPESERIERLLRRDGPQATRAWVERTLGIYRDALADRTHYAADPWYKRLFERSVREFEDWLAAQQL